MQIAVQGDFFRKEEAPVESEFFTQLWLQEPRKHGVELVFPVFSSATNHPLQSWGAITILKPPALLPVAAWSQKWKFRQQIPSFLKKQAAQLFIGQDAVSSSVPQLLFITSPHAVDFTGKNGKIVVPTQWAASEMAIQYAISPEKTAILPIAPPPVFTPAEWQIREDIKSQYADGSEYFVFYAPAATAADLLCLLKAFSVFKKWQKSSMKLVMINPADALLPDMETYRYRVDVTFLRQLAVTEIAQVTAGAWCQVHPVAGDTLGMSVLQALHCEVPVITISSPALQETGGEACLYTEQDDFNAIGQEMIRIYKDEALRNRLVLAGKEKTAGNHLAKSAEIAWHLIRELTS